MPMGATAASMNWVPKTASPARNSTRRPALADFGCQTGQSWLGSNHQRAGSVRGTDQDRSPAPSDGWSVPRTRRRWVSAPACKALTT